MEPAPLGTALPLPRPVRVAAFVLAGYGLAVLINATVAQTSLGWDQVEARGFGRAVVRFAGMALIAWGLLKGARWAWWFAVVMVGFFLFAGTAALVTLFALTDASTADFSPGTLWFLVAADAALTTAFILLLLPVSRGAFKRPAV